MIGELAKWLVGFGLARWLIVAGLVITLIGAWLGFNGVWVTEDQALEIGQARGSGDDRKQSLQLPAVQNLLRQSGLARWGFAFIGLGTFLQIVGVVMTPRQALPVAQMAPPPPARPPTPEERDPRRRPRTQPRTQRPRR